MKQPSSGFTLLEVLLSLAIGAVLIASLLSTTGQIASLEAQASGQHELESQIDFALQRMSSAGTASNRLLLPLHDRWFTTYTEHDREQFVPAQTPPAGTTFATAVFAVAQDPNVDLDGDGTPDADNDGDGRIDEDWPSDMSNDAKPGLVLIDDDGDGSVDEGSTSTADDDELLNLSEDPVNFFDDDNDGSVDEDPGNDMNGDGRPGRANVDDDGDGSVDEGNNNDDDEDGQEDEDWVDARVFYLVGSNLTERQPVPWDENSDGDQTGLDYVESVVLENVTYFRTQVLSEAHDRSQLVAITLSAIDANGLTVTRSRDIRIREVW